MTTDLSTMHLDHSVQTRELSLGRSGLETITLTNGQELRQVHPFIRCMGRHCSIHNPSEHPLSDFDLHWRDDRGIMERICVHGIGHPDHDDMVYRMDFGVHGCDGCCMITVEGVPMEPVRNSIKDNGVLRTFESGATRDTSENKIEPWGFTSALAELAFSDYMMKHQTQSDGEKRASDNWKKGIPVIEFYKSLSRHILDLKLIWDGHDDFARTPDLIEALCAIKFNVDGMLHELVKEKGATEEDDDE